MVPWLAEREELPLSAACAFDEARETLRQWGFDVDGYSVEFNRERAAFDVVFPDGEIHHTRLRNRAGADFIGMIIKCVRDERAKHHSARCP